MANGENPFIVILCRDIQCDIARPEALVIVTLILLYQIGFIITLHFS